MSHPDIDLELRILSPEQTTDLIPLTLCQMLAFAAVGKFPRAIQIDHLVIGWRYRDLLNWISGNYHRRMALQIA